MGPIFNKHIASLTGLSLIFLIACGGDGGSEPPADEAPTWAAGVYADEANFKNRCENPRVGSDINGNAFPDIQGSTLLENNWLRSWNNNTYLWYDEVTDINPAGFSSTLEYFALLKTDQTTSSGAPKDQFHFTYDSAEYLKLTQSGVSSGYGAEWAIIANTPPRKLVVAFTEPNSPASQPSVNLQRGTEILTVDGVDFVNANDQASVDIINAALFPDSNGEQHTFTVRDVGSNNTRSVTMTSAEITQAPVRNVATIQTQNSNVGYLLFNAHIATAEEGLFNAMTELASANIDELVLDLRYNGGGLLAVASQLSYMIAGATQTSQKTFELTQFNDKHPTTNPVTGATLAPVPFYDQTLGFSMTEGQALPSLNLSRVFILSTGGTCSASEAIINGLRGINVEVVLIGSTTCGKPYGFYPTDNCGTTYFTVQFKGENHLGFGDYSDGFSPMNTLGNVGTLVPGCSVNDDFSQPLGNQQEALLSTAINYMQSGTCPTPSGKTMQAKHQFQPSAASENGIPIYNQRKLTQRLFGLPSKTQQP
ncbi:S41 family peptidase [Aliikangiella sp. IMCC44653]